MDRRAADHLSGSPLPLTERYDVGLADLDGVIYLGESAIAGVSDAVEAAKLAGMRLAYVTNNASRTPDQVLAVLRSIGIQAETSDVITAAQAAATVLAERLPAGAAVLVVGGDGLRQAVAARGFEVVADIATQPAAVVQGYSPTIGWRDLANATIAIHRGALWLATNVDSTVPSPEGLLPGNGALVAAVRAAVTGDPLVAGKPDPAMHHECVVRTGAKKPLVIGDRLDTDIEGANRVGCDSLVVLSGVARPIDVVRATAMHRPTYISEDFSGLLQIHPEPEQDAAGAWICNDWKIQVDGRKLRLVGDGDQLDGLRVICAAAWSLTEEAVPQLVTSTMPAEMLINRFGLQELAQR